MSLKSNININDLIDENCLQWQEVTQYLASRQFAPGDRDNIEQVVIASRYALHQLQRWPQFIDSLSQIQSFELDSEIISLADDEKIDLDQVRKQLRRYRHQKLLEIIFLDVVQQIPIESSLHHLSDLADQLIRTALKTCTRQLSTKHGQPLDEQGDPMELNIIAMGKLGGRELNFSSDIDLICCYANEGELSGFGQLSYQEYFTRLVRLLTGVLSESTEDGFVYRVDLRLRPWGESGPVALSHSALEHYYQLHGREWEQYAMVKSRILTGSAEDQRNLRSILKPFVYRKYHDYRVFEGLAALKDKIDMQAKSRDMQDNIKIGQGGIREIEFFVQAFQILKGGRNRQLQSTEIFHCFDTLENQQIVSVQTVRSLRDAYRFLRLLENRLQMYDDQQTHDLPGNEVQQARIAQAMKFSSWASLCSALQVHRRRVSRCFSDLFKRDVESRTEMVIDAGFSGDADPQQLQYIQASGVADAEEINRLLSEFVKSKAWSFMSARAKQRFSSLLPDLLKSIGQSRQQAILFQRLLKLFSSIAGRSVYFELLVQNRPLLDKLVNLFDSSEWIAAEVSQYPMLLENLIQTGGAERFDQAILQQRLRLQLDNVAGDTELELDSLRLFKREQSLVIAIAELAREINATEVSRYLCDLAEVMLEAVYQLALVALELQYGIPRCIEDGKKRRAEFAIIGYGKLGGLEMHYQSDLDVIFLHDSSGDEQHSDGNRRIDNSMYFARLAQKIISMTSVLTGSGKLYEIDSRLRPEGSSGLLVSSTQAYLRYQLEKAWTWEHQALVRARLVAGNALLGPEFNRIREQVLRLKRDDDQLKRDIVKMYDRIYQNKKPPEADRKNLKYSRGCMVNIEFLVQYWVLIGANSIGSSCLYSDNISLLNELFRLNLISSSQSRLVEIYQTYHRLLHESVLHNESAEIDAEIIAAEVAQVSICWDHCFSLEK